MPYIIYHVNRRIQIGSIEIKFTWRSGKNSMGRFGGGWNWEVGFQLGGSSLIVNLLFCSLWFRKVKAKS
jgi:hypothetical protein